MPSDYSACDMKTCDIRVVKYTAAIIILVIVITGGYFLDLSLLTYKWYTPVFQVKEPSGKSPEITIVTMYLDIGSFDKGTIGNKFTPGLYKKWMKTWAWLTNRVIGFFDSDEALNIFRQIRSSQPEHMTVAIKINRTDMPAFKDLETIRKIFARPGYPKHQPNTVVAEYSCAMNAKHDVLQLAITRGLVHTDYLAWLDIGLFRSLLDPNSHHNAATYTLEVPDDFNSSCVGMSEVTSRNQMSRYSPWEYISQNRVWVSGAFLLGTKQVVWAFSESYKKMVTRLLEQNMISTDQQVIGAMYSPAYTQNQTVGIQSYICHKGRHGLTSADPYFCLGYVCKASAESRSKYTMTTTSKSHVTT